MIYIKVKNSNVVHTAKATILLNTENIKEYKDIDVKNVKKLFLIQPILYGIILKKIRTYGFNILNYSYKEKP